MVFGQPITLYAVLPSRVVLSEYTSVCVRVVATGDNESLDAEFAENLNTLLELFFLLELSTSRADDVETTGIAILVHELRCDLYVVVVNETARTEDEAVEGLFSGLSDLMPSNKPELRCAARSLTA